MIGIGGVMQIFSEIGVGSFVHFYNALVIQHPAYIFNKTSSGVEVCKCMKSLL